MTCKKFRCIDRDERKLSIRCQESKDVFLGSGWKMEDDTGGGRQLLQGLPTGSCLVVTYGMALGGEKRIRGTGHEEENVEYGTDILNFAS